MPATLYRLYFDDAAATREQLDLVERITVEQEIDVAWEARVEVPICTDASGKWSDESMPMLTRVRRVRVEIKVGDGDFVPLIDGPVASVETAMSPTPGQSTATLIVHDDSVFLARHDAQERFDDLLDHEIAGQLYDNFPQIADKKIDDTPAASTGAAAVAVQRGSAMAMLKRLAERNGMHAYVLPGPEPGASVGVFRKLPTKSDGLPPLILLGPDRNLSSFSAQNDGQRPVTVVTHSLDLLDKSTASGNAGPADGDLLGSEAPAASDGEVGTLILRPTDGTVDPQQRAAAAAEQASYAFEASGAVASDCYGDVLLPYRIVTVRGIDGKQSGDYVILQVSHSLDRSVYSQTFRLGRNAASAGSGSGAVSVPAGVL